MSATCVPEEPLTPLSQGYVTFDTHPVVTTSAIGPLPSGQSVSRPLDSSPLPVLQLNIPTDGSLEVQYQHLMETAQRLQGMTLSLRPSFTLAAPEVPL